MTFTAALLLTHVFHWAHTIPDAPLGVHTVHAGTTLRDTQRRGCNIICDGI